MIMKRSFLFAVMAWLCLATGPAMAQDASGVTKDQKTQIEQIVHDYLLQHPEVIKEAIEALQAKEDQQKADDQAQSVTAHKNELYNDQKTPAAGNPTGAVTVVEFCDYHCPYRKAVAEPLQQLLQDDKGIRLVLKE